MTVIETRSKMQMRVAVKRYLDDLDTDQDIIMRWCNFREICDMLCVPRAAKLAPFFLQVWDDERGVRLVYATVVPLESGRTLRNAYLFPLPTKTDIPGISRLRARKVRRVAARED